MASLEIDTRIDGLSTGAIDRANRAERFGFDGVFTSETEEDPFLALPLVADRTKDISLGTCIATAFTRSPMVLAYMAWGLQRFSGGRMILGLGTQVKGHNKRRYSVDFEWERPGPRLREEVRALNHIFDVFQGEEEELSFDGEFFQFSLMLDEFNPGPIEVGRPEVWVGGVNEFNIKLAGHLADGLFMHTFNTPTYIDEVIQPNLDTGADIGNRNSDDVSLSASPFLVTGPDADVRERQRRDVKQRIAFYGSTRTYHDVLAVHGWEDVGEKLHALSKENAWDEMTDLITDEMVEAFAIDAPPEYLADEMLAKYGERADRLIVSFKGHDFWEDVIRDIRTA
jgi:probable F420-dependent oxidoreductase